MNRIKVLITFTACLPLIDGIVRVLTLQVVIITTLLASHLYHHLYSVYIYYYCWLYPIPVNSTYFREQINESTESDVSSLAPHKNQYQHGVRSQNLNPQRSVSSPREASVSISKESCHPNKLMPHTNCWCNFQPHSNNWCHFQLWMHISIIIPTSWCTFQLLMPVSYYY